MQLIKSENLEFYLRGGASYTYEDPETGEFYLLLEKQESGTTDETEN